MRVVYLAAGAAGMYCGSCLRDNRLAATLIARGRDVVLLPMYTPIRTDEIDVSTHRVYYGGINVYLQQHAALFRHTPHWLTALLDSPALLDRAGRLAARTRPAELGALTVSVLKGEHGAQRKELQHLLEALKGLKPDLINLPNLMFLGLVRPLKAQLRIPVICTLSGEDIFLDELPEPYRREAFGLIREQAADVDGFVSVTRYYGDHAVEHFGLSGERVHHVPLGIHVEDFARSHDPPDEPFTIGFLGRVCPAKGLHQLADALIELRRRGRQCRLRAAGYLGAADRPYLEAVRKGLEHAGCGGAFEYVGEVSREQKRQFLSSLHVFSMPTVYVEAKGLPVLEAMAVGVPVVQPAHGSFPELIEATGGGLLYDPAKPHALVQALERLMDDPVQRRRLGDAGCASVVAPTSVFRDEVMAEGTWALYKRWVEQGAGAVGAR